MTINFSNWLQNRLLQEVRGAGKGVVYAPEEETRTARENLRTRRLMAAAQKEKDMVYFGIHTLMQQYKSDPNFTELPKLDISEMIPLLGAVIDVDGDQNIVVTLPQAKGRIRTLGQFEKAGADGSVTLRIPPGSLYDITDAIQGYQGAPGPQGPQKMWLFADNPYQKEVAKKIQAKIGFRAPEITKDQVNMARYWLHSMGEPVEAQPEKPQTLQDLFPDEPAPQQPQQQSPQPSNFGKTQTYSQGGTVRPNLSQRQGYRQGVEDPEVAALKKRLDFAWNQSLKYGDHWKMISENRVFPYYPE